MQTTQIRVERVNKRLKQRRKQRLNRMILSLIALCCMLAVQEVYFISTLQQTNEFYTSKNKLYGATFLFSDAGGYVLVAIITFVIAVALTLFCIKKAEQTKQTENGTQPKEEDEV